MKWKTYLRNIRGCSHCFRLKKKQESLPPKYWIAGDEGFFLARRLMKDLAGERGFWRSGLLLISLTVKTKNPSFSWVRPEQIPPHYIIQWNWGACDNNGILHQIWRRRRKIKEDLMWNQVNLQVGLRIGWKLDRSLNWLIWQVADIVRLGLGMGLNWDNRHCQLETELN